MQSSVGAGGTGSPGDRLGWNGPGFIFHPEEERERGKWVKIPFCASLTWHTGGFCGESAQSRRWCYCDSGLSLLCLTNMSILCFALTLCALCVFVCGHHRLILICVTLSRSQVLLHRNKFSFISLICLICFQKPQALLTGLNDEIPNVQIPLKYGGPGMSQEK